jgi:hypothetical protein
VIFHNAALALVIGGGDAGSLMCEVLFGDFVEASVGGVKPRVRAISARTRSAPRALLACSIVRVFHRACFHLAPAPATASIFVANPEAGPIPANVNAITVSRHF